MDFRKVKPVILRANGCAAVRAPWKWQSDSLKCFYLVVSHSYEKLWFQPDYFLVAWTPFGVQKPLFLWVWFFLFALFCSLLDQFILLWYRLSFRSFLLLGHRWLHSKYIHFICFFIQRWLDLCNTLCLFRMQSFKSFLAFICVRRFHSRAGGAFTPLTFGPCIHQADFWVFVSEWDILQEIQVCKALFKSSGWGTTVFVLMYLLFLWVNGWHSVFVGLPAKLWSGNWVYFKVECFRQCFNCTRANSINIHSSIKLFSTISTYCWIHLCCV